MGVVIESEVWEPRPLWYLLLAFASFSSIFLFPHFATRGAAKPSGASLPLDSGGPSAPFLRFQRTFLLLFSLASYKRIWLLITAQACHHFSESIFWILWAPTIVADGREARLPLLYPCFLGSRMLGSTLIPWFSSAASPMFNKDYPTAAFIIAGFCLAVVAYDYQDIDVLMILFCIYNICAGLISPSLAHLRTMYVPAEVRGGMISLSLVPSSAAILFFLIQGGYYRNVSNSTILAFSALGLFAGAGALHALKRWRKQIRQNRHKM